MLTFVYFFTSSGGSQYKAERCPRRQLERHRAKREARVPVWRGPRALRRSLEIPLGEFAECVGNGTGKSQRDGSVSDGLPSESIADPVNGAVGHPTRHASFGPGPALLIFKPKWEFQLR